MQTQDNAKAKSSNGSSFFNFASQRLILAIILIVAVLWGGEYTLNRLELTTAGLTMLDGKQHTEQASGLFTSQNEQYTTEKDLTSTGTVEKAAGDIQEEGLHGAEVKAEEKSAADSTVATLSPPSASHQLLKVDDPAMTPAAPGPKPEAQIESPAPQAQPAQPPKATPPPVHTAPSLPPTQPASPPAQAPYVQHPAPAPHAQHPVPTPHIQQPAPAPRVPHAPPHVPETKHEYRPTGVTFVEAAIQPIDHELNNRFWGWRPNDIINPTDNINNFQLGVLEVTRRTAVQLAERISRTGSADAINPHLQNAMNWFMVKADRYWFPAPETKYKESLKELEEYKQALINGKATFYTRTVNIIPLLMAFEDLLGSCDESLVKHSEVDGSKVSIFKADDYFYYAKGVASAMAVILEAIHHDFSQTLENRNGSELLHHAVESCKMAAELSPWYITDSNLDGFFANHRANMAAPISHARVYISQLIKTLST